MIASTGISQSPSMLMPASHVPEGALATTPATITARKTIPLSQRSFRSSLDLPNGRQISQEASNHHNSTSGHSTRSPNPNTTASLVNTPQDSHDSHGVGAYMQDRYIRSGWLYKRGKRKTWKKRWFVLRDSQLVYYKDDKEYKPKDIISTADIMAVAMLTDQHKPNHFAFFTPSKNYNLRADSTQDAEAWVEKLKQSLEYASQHVLSSSFQRLSTLDEVEKDFGDPFNTAPRKPITNRHSMMAGAGQAIVPALNQSANFPKRHSIDFSASPSHLASAKQRSNMNISSKLPSPPGKTSFDNLGRSLESAGTGNTSYATNSLFSGREEMAHSSCPSDHSSPIVLSNIAEPKPQLHNRQRSELSLRHNVVDDYEEEEHLETPLAPPKGEETILETGHLLRLKKRYKHWRNQWVALSNERLVFYKNEKSKSPVKVIPIENLIDVVELDAMSKSKQYCMQLITPEKRIRFCALSEEDLIRWLASIKAVIDASPNTASIGYDHIEEE